MRPKISQKGSKIWDHVTFQRRKNDATRRETANASENGKVKPPKDLSAWVARWADRTGCRVAVPNTGSRWVGVKKCYMKGCEWEKILTAMENRERRGKEETLLEDSKGSICECIYTSRTSQDFSLSYLIL